MKVKRTDIAIRPDPSRVMLRPLNVGSEERMARIVARVLAMSEETVAGQLAEMLAGFAGRHRDLPGFLARRFEQVRRHAPASRPLSQARQMLIAACLTMEYALECAALFNPSPVWHPDQTGLPAGGRRFILGLRATGEGHISSIVFRSGVIDARGHITLDPPTPFVTPPEVLLDPGWETSSATTLYEVRYTSEQPLSERVIFPAVPAERNGIEDARFVAFCADDGGVTYYATYTAYDGVAIRSQLLETTDFLRFKVSALHGPAIRNKGLALFPRKVNGRYAMLGRQDNENLYLMFSDELYCWDTHALLLEPAHSWEAVQIGNCGSPIETEAGWLVLTHGVGPMRKYAIGACLLDLHDPSRVIGRLKEPLLSPDEREREGYVPNVVYTCGALVHGRELILPYAMSDIASSFAIVDLDDLLSELVR